MTKPSIAILHYSAPPVVGGVEAVIEAHARLLAGSGYPVTVIAGRGEKTALPDGCELALISELNSQHPDIIAISSMLEQGQVPHQFTSLASQIKEKLVGVLTDFSYVIIHNVLTKHFNLPLTKALHELIDRRLIHHPIAWCHDISWASPNSRGKLHPGSPWDLLRLLRDDVTYVAVSRQQQEALARAAECPSDRIEVIHNGVDPQELLGLSEEGFNLISRLKLFNSDLTLLMPVRITRAKNIELGLQVTHALKSLDTAARLVVTGPPDPHSEESMHYFDELRELRKRLDLGESAYFVFDDPQAPWLMSQQAVGDLFRVSDLLFMPSHREGFGMPVLEAGLAALPVFCTSIPAAVEIGGQDVTMIGPDDDPDAVARTILRWTETNPVYRLRRRVRQTYMWENLFHTKIEPLFQV